MCHFAPRFSPKSEMPHVLYFSSFTIKSSLSSRKISVSKSQHVLYFFLVDQCKIQYIYHFRKTLFFLGVVKKCAHVLYFFLFLVRKNTIHLWLFKKKFVNFCHRQMSTCIVFFSGFSAENTIKVSLLQNTVFGFSLSNVHMYCIFSWVFWKKIQYIYHLKKIFFFRNLVGQMSTCIVFFLGFLEKNTIKVSLETKLFFFFLFLLS